MVKATLKDKKGAYLLVFRVWLFLASALGRRLDERETKNVTGADETKHRFRLHERQYRYFSRTSDFLLRECR